MPTSNFSLANDIAAASGIGSSNAAINLVTTNLQANTVGGEIFLHNVPSGNVTLAGMVTQDASNLTYKQDGYALDVTAALISHGGTIIIDPPTDVTLNSAISTSGNGGVNIQTTQSLVMAPTASVSTGCGAVGIQAVGSITLAKVNAGNGAVAISSASGNIGSALPAGVNNVTAGNVTLNASTGISLAVAAQRL